MGWSSESKNAIEEILSVMKANSQEISQMKTNILYDLQKYHREGWLMIRDYHFDFVFKVIKENIQRGRTEGLYREDFDVDTIAKLHLSTGFSLFDEQLFPFDSIPKSTLFNEFIMHFLHGIVSPKGLSYLKKKLS